MGDLINQLDLHKKNVLDIGCYDGTLLSRLRNKDNNLWGIEANPYLTSRAIKKGVQVKNFLLTDETRLPFHNGFFELVIAGEFIEHVYDPVHFLKEVRRVLAPKGKLLISTPNLASLSRRCMLFLGINPFIEPSLDEPDSVGHIRYYTFKILERLLNQQKFQVIERRSDVLNLSNTGQLRLPLLPKLLPHFGQSIIFLAGK